MINEKKRKIDKEKIDAINAIVTPIGIKDISTNDENIFNLFNFQNIELLLYVDKNQKITFYSKKQNEYDKDLIKYNDVIENFSDPSVKIYSLKKVLNNII